MRPSCLVVAPIAELAFRSVRRSLTLKSPCEAATYQAVKKAYAARSKVVHGMGMDRAALSAAYGFASDLLVKVLRKMVDLGRVPAMAELDRVAASGSLFN